MQRDESGLDITKEFSRFAHTYGTYSIIQKEVSKCLLKQISNKDYQQIVDVGCGSGSVYNELIKNNFHINSFVALDASSKMLSLHPSDKNIIKQCANFDKKNVFYDLPYASTRLLISSSALQWSKDLNLLFKRLSSLSTDAYFAIFTSNTFRTLHETASLASPIYSAETLKSCITQYYNASFELKEYRLDFKSTLEMLRYIKKSGVSGGEKQLSYMDMKHLMKAYPLRYLEFEVLFVNATSLYLK